MRVGTDGVLDFYLKPLADGSHALVIFNRGNESVTAGLIKLSRMGVGGKLLARDLWRQQDIPDFDPNKITFAIPANGVVFLKLWPKK